MGRAPCCVKMGLKKGPWTPEEDHLLVNYIRLHGHNNWRALPKQAGLLRCGKSCRLRWTNYLRPDIKRGNFSQDEEETIIKLHEMLGNRWSAIAARLPGRTDNEIKNVWHTHLKKRLSPLSPKLECPTSSSPVNSGGSTTTTSSSSSMGSAATAAINVAVGPTRKRSRKASMSKRDVAPKKRVLPTHENSMEPSGNDEGTNESIVKEVKIEPVSPPQPCTSEVSTVTSTSSSTTSITTTTITTTTTTTTTNGSENDDNASLEENAGGKEDIPADLPEINDDFWMEVLSVEDTAISTEDLPCISQSDDHILATEPMYETEYQNVNCEDMDVFWHNLLTKSQEILEITEMV